MFNNNKNAKVSPIPLMWLHSCIIMFIFSCLFFIDMVVCVCMYIYVYVYIYVIHTHMSDAFVIIYANLKT